MIIVGMNDPTHSKKELILHPQFKNSSGRRIFSLSGASMREWLTKVKRQNVLISKTWDLRKARERGRNVRNKLSYRGETVVVLGKQTWLALCLDPTTDWMGRDPSGQFVLIGHPSGRNLWYNSEGNKARVRELIQSLINEGKPWPRRREPSPRGSSLSARSTKTEVPSTAMTTSRPAECTPPCSPED